jgi:hypothetical protein
LDDKVNLQIIALSRVEREGMFGSAAAVSKKGKEVVSCRVGEEELG